MADAENSVESKNRRRRSKQEAAEVVEAEEEVAVTTGKGRATPGRRNQVEEKVEGNIVTRSVGGVREYFDDVRSELNKVSWPTREEAIRLTRIVLITLVLSSVVFGLVNGGYALFVRFGLANPIAFVLLIIAAVGGAVWFMRGETSGGKY